jgi:hypothetical protein
MSFSQTLGQKPPEQPVIYGYPSWEMLILTVFAPGRCGQTHPGLTANLFQLFAPGYSQSTCACSFAYHAPADHE